jgi:hypothetical protein
VKAAPDDQLRLLDLQAFDSTLDRLAHRRTTLPEIEQAAALGARIAQLGDDVVRAETEDRDLGRAQQKVDADVEQVRSRMQRDQQRLDAGQVGSPRELQNLSHEIESLHRRQTELEDAELEVMEQRETVQARVTALRAEHEQATASLQETEQRRDAAVGQIETEVSAATAARGELADALPADLLALYDKLRASSAGVGAAALHRGRCEGCHLQLNTIDLNRLRDAPPDDVVRCEECRRILVRTPESGLASA